MSFIISGIVSFLIISGRNTILHFDGTIRVEWRPPQYHGPPGVHGGAPYGIQPLSNLKRKKLQSLENVSTVSSVSEGNILHLSDYEYKSLSAAQHCSAHCCSIEIAGCIYRILRPSLIFLVY